MKNKTTVVAQKTDLKSFILNTFNYMGAGLLISALTAFLTINFNLITLFIKVSANGASLSLLGYLVIFSPLIFLFFIANKLYTMEPAKAKGMFFAFSVLMGLSLSISLLGYSVVSIARAFLITASTFGAMSIYGYTTKKDLTSVGSFMFMGLIGVIIASIINIFLGSAQMSFIIDILTVIIFVGFTAYDIQKLKVIHTQMGGSSKSENVAVFGALTLYLDFINLFLAILRLTGGGDRK